MEISLKEKQKAFLEKVKKKQEKKQRKVEMLSTLDNIMVNEEKRYIYKQGHQTRSDFLIQIISLSVEPISAEKIVKRHNVFELKKVKSSLITMRGNGVLSSRKNALTKEIEFFLIKESVQNDSDRQLIRTLFFNNPTVKYTSYDIQIKLGLEKTTVCTALYRLLRTGFISKIDTFEMFNRYKLRV